MNNASPQPGLFRLRVAYVKRGRLAYLGHLEVIHTIERSIRRAGLPYAVTQGFSPHMRTGYTSALPVGTSSRREYYDVFLTELVPARDAFERLRAASPADLAPQACAYLDVRTPALTAQITRAAYRIELEPPAAGSLDAEAVAHALDAVRAEGSLAYRRGAKCKRLDLDRNLVDASVRACGGGIAIELDTRCDNEGSLRPEILLAALDQRLRGVAAGEEDIVSTGTPSLASFGRMHIERTGQFVECDGALTDPLEARGR